MPDDYPLKHVPGSTLLFRHTAITLDYGASFWQRWDLPGAYTHSSPSPISRNQQRRARNGRESAAPESRARSSPDRFPFACTATGPTFNRSASARNLPFARGRKAHRGAYNPSSLTATSKQCRSQCAYVRAGLQVSRPFSGHLVLLPGAYGRKRPGFRSSLSLALM